MISAFSLYKSHHLLCRWHQNSKHRRTEYSVSKWFDHKCLNEWISETKMCDAIFWQDMVIGICHRVRHLCRQLSMLLTCHVSIVTVTYRNSASPPSSSSDFWAGSTVKPCRFNSHQWAMLVSQSEIMNFGSAITCQTSEIIIFLVIILQWQHKISCILQVKEIWNN